MAHLNVWCWTLPLGQVLFDGSNYTRYLHWKNERMPSRHLWFVCKNTMYSNALLLARCKMCETPTSHESPLWKKKPSRFIHSVWKITVMVMVALRLIKISARGRVFRLSGVWNARAMKQIQIFVIRCLDDDWIESYQITRSVSRHTRQHFRQLVGF